MAQGAVFKLVLRDDRFDKYFTATDLLKSRIDAIRDLRANTATPNHQPTFSDIERSHLLYIRSSYRPYVNIASEYTRIKASGDGTSSIGPAGGTIQFTIPTYGQFTSDMAIHIKFKAIGTQSPIEGSPYFRYCALPGVRMFKNISLRSDQVIIDEYTPDDVIAHSKFFVRADQRTSWERCNGQQEAKEASFYSNEYTGTFIYRDGPQTPKTYHEGFDIYAPLQFWCCGDVSHALLNAATATSQRTVTCELAPISDIVQALSYTPNNINPFDVLADLPLTKLEFQVFLYVNNLFVNPEIYDIFASRVGFSLIRVHRRQINQIQHAKGSFLLDQLKFPAEYLMVGIRNRQLVNDFDRWWLMGTPAIRINTNSLTGDQIIPSPGGVVQLFRIARETSTLENVVDTIGVTAHGVEIFAPLPSLFYNAYMPFRYPESSMVVAPVDACAFLVNFCLYPGKFNPSGYYNLSAGREMYINYSLKDFYSSITGGEFEMVISMSALNFIIRNEDRLHLRYSL